MFRALAKGNPINAYDFVDTTHDFLKVVIVIIISLELVSVSKLFQIAL
jgi:hypothetical protein